MDTFWTFENDRESVTRQLVAQNTDSWEMKYQLKWNHDLVLYDILISLFYLLHPILLLPLWI